MRLFLLCTSLLVSFTVPVFSQTATLPAQGYPVYGTFQLGQLDGVNLQNLNVNVVVPTSSMKGRGLDMSFAGVNDSLIYVPQNGAWVPVNGSDGQPNFGWKENSPVGSMSYQSETVTCASDHTTAQHYHGYVYIEQLGTRHEFPLDFYSAATACSYNTGPTNAMATDSSGLFMVASSPTQPYLRFPNGLTVNANASGLTDTNGNYIKQVVVNASETDWHDSLRRTAAKIIYSPTEVDFDVLDKDGSYQLIKTTLTNYNIKTNFGCAGLTEYSDTATLPSSITLANGRSYTFAYEATPGAPGYITGRIQKVTLPTGGYYEYDYSGANDGINCADGSALSLTRIVNDGQSSATWQYSRSEIDASTWKTVVTAPALPYETAGDQTVYTFVNGLESSRVFYSGNEGGLVLKTVNTSYSAAAPPFTRTVTTALENNQQSKIETDFDQYQNVTGVREYDWGSGAPGVLLRKEAFSYLSYSWQNIRDRVTQHLIYDGSGTLKYRQDTTYDSYGAGITCITGVPGHDDVSYPCSKTTRGNPTSVTVYTNAAAGTGAITKNRYYDSLGNVIQADADCCRSMAWNYSSTAGYAFPDSIVHGPSGGPQLTTTYTYNAYTSEMESSTDPNNKKTTYSYDTLNRLTDVGRPDGTHVTYSYDDVGNSVALTSPVSGTDKVQETTYFDGLGRAKLTATADASGTLISETSTQYGPLGRIYRVSNPYTGSPQYWTEHRYDPLGRETMVIPPDGSASANNTSYLYSGNTTLVTDPAGKQVKNVYDAIGRLTTVYEPDVSNQNNLTQATNYSYSVLDANLSVSQGAQTRSFVYDDSGRLTSSTTPESGTVSLQYDSYNRLTQKTDARGVIATYTYDGLNRPAQIAYNVGSTGVPGSSSVGFTYGTDANANNIGRLVTRTDGLGSESYTYDLMGRTTGVTRIVNGVSYPVSYSFNDAGKVTSITYPSGRVLSYGYDSIGRSTNIKSGDGLTTYASGAAYNSAGQLTAFSYGNGVQATFGYNAQNLQLGTLSYATSTQTLFSETYGYSQNGGNNGQITRIDDQVQPGRSATYSYDALNRVSAAVTDGSTAYPRWGLSWSYDRYGNRTAQTVTAGTGYNVNLAFDQATNRIVDDSYDANGNLTYEAGVDQSYVYDAANRLINFNSGAATYAYDAAGMRLTKISGGTTTTYIYSNKQVIAEYNNGTLSKEYIYQGDKLLASIADGATTYYQEDQRSTRMLTDSSGNVSGERGDYPFGETWYEQNATTDRAFSSYLRDGDSGNDYALARYYGNRAGRFVSPDPISGDLSDPQSLNGYAYVQNDPVNSSDPSGMVDIPPFMFTVTVWAPEPDPFQTDPFFQCGLYGFCGGPTNPGPLGPHVPSLPNRVPIKTRILSKKCLQGLRTAGTTTKAVDNANAAYTTLRKAGAAHDISPTTLGAIGIRETGFQNIFGDHHHGRGIFQIDDRYHPEVSMSEAFDPGFASNWAAATIHNAFNKYHMLGFSDSLSLAAAIRDYNGHSKRTPSTISILRHGGGPAQLNAGTTGNDYVTDVLALRDCFH